MRIGIVGSGQLGQHTKIRLEETLKNCSTYVYSRSQGFNACKVEVAEEIVGSNDIVINCAAMTDVDRM